MVVPDPRAIFDLATYVPSRSLRKSIRRAGWEFAVDRDLEGVMRGCAAATTDRPNTWITEDFINAYVTLHRRGLAHSVEVYEGGELVGGLYGVTFGAFFGGESMFHRTDASKAAVSYLVEHLRERNFLLLDAQVPNPHLMSLGAVESRARRVPATAEGRPRQAGAVLMVARSLVWSGLAALCALAACREPVVADGTLACSTADRCPPGYRCVHLLCYGAGSPSTPRDPEDDDAGPPPRRTGAWPRRRPRGRRRARRRRRRGIPAAPPPSTAARLPPTPRSSTPRPRRPTAPPSSTYT